MNPKIVTTIAIPPLWRDTRFLRVVGPFAILNLTGMLVVWLFNSNRRPQQKRNSNGQ